MRATGRAAAVLGIVCAALVVSGCSTVNRFTGVKNTVFTQEQIVGALANPTAPRGFSWEAGRDGGATVADVIGDTTQWWNENGGDPQSCYDVYAASSITSSADTGGALDQLDFALGRFDDDKADDRYSLLGLAVRLFPSSMDAEVFVDALSESVRDCPNGYELVSEGDKFWSAESFQLSEAPALGRSNVRAVTLEELVGSGSAAAGYRTVFLERGNAVVSVIAELNEGETVDFREQDDIARAVSEAMSRLRGNG